MVFEERTNEWSLSDYPIQMALILMVAIAISLWLEKNQAYVNQLAVLAYFLLAAGIVIRFIEPALPETLSQNVKAKIHQIDSTGLLELRWSIQKVKVKISRINKNEDFLKSEKEIKIDYFADVTKNVFFSLLVFFLTALIYGISVDWFFVEMFIGQLGYLIGIFLALHLVLRAYGSRS